MEKKKDYCSGFFESWYKWTSTLRWEKVDISHLCKDHDDEEDTRGGCDSTKFAKGLMKNRIVGAIPIFVVSSIACWIKYPFNMMKRV